MNDKKEPDIVALPYNEINVETVVILLNISELRGDEAHNKIRFKISCPQQGLS